MKCSAFFIMIFMVMISACSSIAITGSTKNSSEICDKEQVYYGNIYGTIRDSRTGSPIENAVVYVIDSPVRYLAEASNSSVLSDQGPVIIPDRSNAVGQSVSRADGAFLINSVPIHGSSQLYTVVVEAENRDTTVIDQVPVLPGASLALKIDCRMTSEGKAHIIKILKGHNHVDINYSDELKNMP